MIALFARDGRRTDLPGEGVASLPSDCVWIDLVSPSPSEIARVQQLTGLTVPSFDALSEIETSSRVHVENGAIYLSAPLVHRASVEMAQSTPVGFVLTQRLLITVRFEPLIAFSSVHRNGFCARRRVRHGRSRVQPAG